MLLPQGAAAAGAAPLRLPAAAERSVHLLTVRYLFLPSRCIAVILLNKYFFLRAFCSLLASVQSYFPSFLPFLLHHRFLCCSALEGSQIRSFSFLFPLFINLPLHLEQLTTQVMGRDAACLPRRGAAAGAAAAAAVLLLLGGSIPSPIPITTPTTSSSSSSSNGGGVVLCALASEVADPSYGASSGFPSGGSGLSDQLSQIFSSVGPFVSQLLSGGSGDGVEGVGDSGGGGGGPGGALGALYEMGRRAAGALSTSLASDEARESMWVPLHEQIGVARDMLGLPGDDAQGVRSAARLLLAAQLPIARFAAEREACDDEEADNRALKIVNEYPTTKK